MRAAESGSFARAESLVDAETDPVIAARARVWLLFRARDFDAAFEAAGRGLALAPGDVWLAERATACALWLGDPWRAQPSLARFAANVAGAEAPLRESFGDALVEARTTTARLVAGMERMESSRARARATALAVLGAVIVLLAALGRDLRRRRT